MSCACPLNTELWSDLVHLFTNSEIAAEGRAVTQCKVAMLESFEHMPAWFLTVLWTAECKLRGIWGHICLPDKYVWYRHFSTCNSYRLLLGYS